MMSGDVHGSMLNFKTNQSLRDGGSKYKGQKSAKDTIAIQQSDYDGDKIMIPIN
jgi:hypothetical protein